jgi:hypothetical protein
MGLRNAFDTGRLGGARHRRDCRTRAETVRARCRGRRNQDRDPATEWRPGHEGLERLDGQVQSAYRQKRLLRTLRLQYRLRRRADPQAALRIFVRSNSCVWCASTASAMWQQHGQFPSRWEACFMTFSRVRSSPHCAVQRRARKRVRPLRGNPKANLGSTACPSAGTRSPN